MHVILHCDAEFGEKAKDDSNSCLEINVCVKSLGYSPLADFLIFPVKSLFYDREISYRASLCLWAKASTIRESSARETHIAISDEMPKGALLHRIK